MYFYTFTYTGEHATDVIALLSTQANLTSRTVTKLSTTLYHLGPVEMKIKRKLLLPGKELYE